MRLLALLASVAWLSHLAHSIDHRMKNEKSLAVRMMGEDPTRPVEEPNGGPEPEPKFAAPKAGIDPEGALSKTGAWILDSVRSFVRAFLPTWSLDNKGTDQIVKEYEDVRIPIRATWAEGMRPMFLTNEAGTTVHTDTEVGVTQEDFADFEKTTETTEDGRIIYRFDKPMSYRNPNDRTEIIITYERLYLTPLKANEIGNFHTKIGFLRKRSQGPDQHKKRDGTLSSISGSQLTSPSNLTQNMGDFEDCVNALATIQQAIGSLIFPVLNGFVTRFNNTFITTMAQSVYLDITASTTTLIGPFNHGMQFINSTYVNRITPVVAATNQTMNSTMQSPILILQNLYTAMWIESMEAANSTGLLIEQTKLLGYLQTNDSSLYPAGYNNTSQVAIVPNFQN